MTIIEAIEHVLILAQEHVRDICYPGHENDEDAIRIVRDIVLARYKPEILDDDTQRK